MIEAVSKTKHTPVVIEKLALTPAEFKKNYLFKNRPVVLTNATEHWPALNKFTPEFFKKNYGDVIIPIADVNYKLGDYIDMMHYSSEEHPAPYPCKLKLTSQFKELIADISPRPAHTLPDRANSKLIPRRFFSGVDTFEIFFGGGGGWFPYLHYDVLKLHAVINQIYGEKEFIVYTPDQAPYMYVNPEIRWQSSIKRYYDPDYEVYPLFKNAVPHKISIKAGETMFIPCGWWHTAHSLTPNISVAFDILNRSNWSVFVEEVAAMSRKTRPVKSLAANAFLSGLGALFNFMEVFNL